MAGGRGGGPGRPDCVMVIAHGVGNQERWSELEAFQAGLFDFLNRRLRTQAEVTTRPVGARASLDRGFDLLLKPVDPNAATSPGNGVRVRLREFFWADLDGGVTPSPIEFLRILGWLAQKLFSAHYGRLVPPGVGWWKGFWLYSRLAFLGLGIMLGALAGLIAACLHGLVCLFGFYQYGLTSKIAGGLMEYLEDITRLDDVEVRAAINQRFNRVLTDILAVDRPRSLVIVSHSLGAVFALDQLKRQLRRAGVPLGWVVLGGPLWAMPVIDKDFDYERDFDLDLDLGWYNIYDLFDVIGGPIFHPRLANPDEQWHRRYLWPLSAHTKYLVTEKHVAKLWELTARFLAELPAEVESDASLITARARLNRRPLRLGPFLRHSRPDRLTVFTAVSEPGRYRAELFPPGGEPLALEAELGRENERTRHWVFEGLTPETEYEFRLSRLDRNGRAWPLTRRNLPGERLNATPTSWRFTTPKAEGEVTRLLFASCNHPFHVGWDGEAGNRFLGRLLAEMERRPELIPDAGFYIGDQIYADDFWQDELYLPWPDEAERFAARLRSYGQVYDRFWSHPFWAELMRLAPGYMIWDDHEIRDGWGCNVHDFDGDRFKTSAYEKFLAAAEAFRLYQSLGNPPPDSEHDFQFTIDIGPASLFVFDNRMHRCFRQADEFHPYGADQMERFEAWAAEAGRRAEVLIVVTSTPPVFFQPWRLDFVADRLAPAFRGLEKLFDFEAVDDDLRDQLPFRLNILTRDTIIARLADFLTAHPPGAKRAVLVGGDVHVGGYVRIDIDAERRIDQWIASPITNIPNSLMYKAARWAKGSQIVGRRAGRRYKAHRFFFSPRRNAVLLSLLPPDEDGRAVKVKGEFLYENRFGLKVFSKTLA